MSHGQLIGLQVKQTNKLFFLLFLKELFFRVESKQFEILPTVLLKFVRCPTTQLEVCCKWNSTDSLLTIFRNKIFHLNRADKLSWVNAYKKNTCKVIKTVFPLPIKKLPFEEQKTNHEILDNPIKQKLIELYLLEKWKKSELMHPFCHLLWFSATQITNQPNNLVFNRFR